MQHSSTVTPMFPPQNSPVARRFAAGLAVLSLLSLIFTAWILSNVRHEQEIVAKLIQHLPASDLEAATELSGDLSLQSSLSILLVMNLIATAVALAFVVRGYLTSERSLLDVKVLATDILASMDAGVITTDKNGVITSINPRGTALVGLDDDGVGKRITSIGAEHALLASICSDVGVFHKAIRDRDYCVTLNGHKTTLRAGCTLLRDRQGQEIGTVIHVRDVTEKTLMEERLRRMERYMGLGSLAAGLQHDIKNPLSALSLHVQLLCERVHSGSQEEGVGELLEVLNTEVKRINDVLDRFRNYASIKELGRGPVDIALLVEKLVRLLRPQAKKQGVKIEVKTPPQMLGLIEADSLGLEQVLLNLALNSLAAMPKGGVLRFRVDRQHDSVRIDVEDSGTGIPENIQDKIFDPYFTTRSDGTGMGLALCDKTVRQHNGSIDFKTGPEGTVFTVLLPISVAIT